MTKLSPTQEAILRQMGEGERLVKNSGWQSLFCWETKPRTGPRADSVYKLMALELVGRIARDRWDIVYAITPAGRAYLKGL